MFEWNDAYRVGVSSIDGQHQNLFRLAADLHGAMSTGETKTVLAGLLQKLIQYTKVHFAQEERLMQSCGYPDLLAHKAQHEELIRQVMKFQADYEAGRVAMGVQVLQFLKNWLQHHILETDRKYAPYVHANGNS